MHEEFVGESLGRAYLRLWILFACLNFPIMVSLAVLTTLGRHHVLSYWWVLVAAGAEVFLLAWVYWRVRRYRTRRHTVM